MKKATLFLFCCAMMIAMTGVAQVTKKTVRKTTSTKRTTSPVHAKPAVTAPQNSYGLNPADHSTRVKITTDSGVIIVKLYDSTPLHRDNFVKLVQSKFYDSLMFHRVIRDFMIQGGDPTSRHAAPAVMLGNGGDDMQRIPAEFRQSLYHKRGVLAAARDNNPEKASSACQFYIVEGRVCSDAELDNIERNTGVKYTAEQRQVYKTIGGTPFLDQNYTVFGEVIYGGEVIDKIAHVPADGANRPLGDIRMKMELIQ